MQISERDESWKLESETLRHENEARYDRSNRWLHWTQFDESLWRRACDLEISLWFFSIRTGWMVSCVEIHQRLNSHSRRRSDRKRCEGGLWWEGGEMMMMVMMMTGPKEVDATSSRSDSTGTWHDRFEVQTRDACPRTCVRALMLE